MSDRQQAQAGITRRGFLGATFGTLLSLPALGGVGLFSQERVAYALTAQEEAGASFTNEELAKITVIRRDQMCVVAVDMSKVQNVVIDNGGLESGTIPPEAFVVGTTVTLTSRYNGVTQTLQTDDEGKVVFDIREMSENEEGADVNALDLYEFNGTLEITCPGFRTFKTALIRVHGTDVLVAPTRSFVPGDATAYPHMISFNEWDVLYLRNEFLTIASNTDVQRLEFEGRGFDSGDVTVTWREQESGATFQSTTATPEDGVVKASFEGTFLQLGAAGSLEIGKAYELAVTQGDLTYVWPLQMSLRKGILSQAINTTLEMMPLSPGGSSVETQMQVQADPQPAPFSPPGSTSDTASLSFTWPKWVPVVGGQKASWLNLIKTPLSVNVDPFGFAQITYTIPIYGYRRDSSKPDEGGWKRYPYDSIADSYKKARESTESMMEKAGSGWNAFKNGVAASDLKTWGVFDFQIYAQFMAAMKWDNKQGIFQGMGGGQLRASCSLTFTMNFYAGPVPVLISFSFIADVVVALMCDMYTLATDAADMPLEDYLPTYLLDVTAWRFDFSNSGLTVSITLTPSLSVGVGVSGIASISLRGKAVFTMSYSLTPAKNRPFPHTTMGFSAACEVVIQFFFYTQTFEIPQLSVPYQKLHDNWDGVKTQDDFTVEVPGPGKFSDFIDGMRIVTNAMLERTSEASGMATQSLDAQAEDDSRWSTTLTMREIWQRAIAEALATAVNNGSGTLRYQSYRFKRPPRAGMTAQADEAVDVESVAPVWHRGSSVRYEDCRNVIVAEGLAPQAEGSFLPEPEVAGVSPAGGVRPKSDVVISTREGGNDMVHGDPRMKVIDIQTSTSAGSSIRATCSFRIGTVDVPGAGMRSRIIMTVLDASDELSWFVGKQRVIDFDIYDADVDHADLFDYDFGLEFSSYSTAAGGVEASIDQVEIVLVSGRRADGDGTSIIAAGTEMYFTYLQFYAQDLLSEDFSNPQYLQLTLSADNVMDPQGAGDGLMHNLSNICCVADTAEANGSLLVAYLDRAAATAEGVFSDDASVCTVRPRFLTFRSDAINVDVMVPDSSALDELLDRLNRSDPSVMRLTLSPKIGGLYTLSLQGQTTSYFYVVGTDAERATLTQAKACDLPESTLNLVPWPAQDCFLTSFANAAYRESAEFKGGTQDTWDRSQWVLQKAWWQASGDGYALGFEEIGPKGFNFSRFALNSSGTFLFWPEGRTGSDEHFYDAEGNHTVTGENDAVYRIMACRVRKNGDGSLHFSDPFIAADLPHDMDSLEAVATFDRYAPFEVISTELVDTGERMPSNTGEQVTLYHAARVWYTSVPNLQCATVIASNCALPAVSAGGTAKFDVTIRNDGNSFLSGCHLQMFVHEVEVDEKGNAKRDAQGNYVDNGVKPVANAGLGLSTTELDVDFAAALQASAYNPADDNGNPTDVEPDRALAPGKRSVYRVEVPIPAEWGDETPNAGNLVVKYISFNATNPEMAEGGGLAAMADDDEGPVYQQFSVEPGSYPVVQNRSSLDQSKDRRFTERVVVNTPTSAIAAYADAPTTIETAVVGSGGTSTSTRTTTSTSTSTKTPTTGDPGSLALPLGLGLAGAGAAVAAYERRRAANERAAHEHAEGESEE